MGNDTCPVESCTKIRFQHIHLRKLDRNRKNSTIWYVQPINPNELYPKLKEFGDHMRQRENFLTSASHPRTISKLDLSCCSTDHAVNPAWSKSWVICVADRVEGTMCTRTYLILYYLPCTLLALCSK